MKARDLVLEHVVPRHAEELADAARHAADAAAPWLPERVLPVTEAAARAFVEEQAARREREEAFYFVAYEREAPGRCVGLVFLNQINGAHRFCNLGYWVRTDASGRGYATAMVQRAARYAFERLDLVRVEILAQPDNIASRRVAEKAGAQEEGRLRHRLWKGDRAVDAVLYSLLPGDLVGQP